MKFNSPQSFLIYLLVLLAINLPYFGLPILYYDDGETLYHAWSWLHGALPYRDIYTHHFTGYIVPVFLLAKIFGYSTELVRVAFILNQALLGLGVYLCAREFFEKRPAFIAGLLAIAAREPFVYSFFPLHQIAVCLIFTLWLCLRNSLASASFVAGIAFTLDQRGIVLIALPLISMVVRRTLPLVRCALAFSIVPLIALALIFYFELWTAFVHQTIRFPAQYRVGSMSLLEQLGLLIKMHRYLVTETPILFLLALLGFLSLLFKKEEKQLIVLLAICVPVVIAFLGGRDYFYYTIPWLPYLALLAIFSFNFFSHYPLLKRYQEFLLAAPLAVLIIDMTQFTSFIPELAKRNQARQIAELLAKEMKPADTLFIFGYRPDIYAEIPHASAYPFANTLYIHPDSSIKTKEQRLKHIVPVKQEEFLWRFSETPPSYLIYVDLKLGEKDWSPAADFVREQAAKNYQLMREIEGPTVEGVRGSLLVYRLRNGTGG